VTHHLVVFMLQHVTVEVGAKSKSAFAGDAFLIDTFENRYRRCAAGASLHHLVYFRFNLPVEAGTTDIRLIYYLVRHPRNRSDSVEHRFRALS
jgi:hypothetical protein